MTLIHNQSLINSKIAPIDTPILSPDRPQQVESQPPHSYVILLATGLEDQGKRATLAFSAACSALAINMKTHLFLVGDGSHWAYEGHAEPIQHSGFPALTELMDIYLELGGHLYICSACDQLCSLPLAEGAALVRRAGIEPRGLVSILSYATTGTTISF